MISVVDFFAIKLNVKHPSSDVIEDVSCDCKNIGDYNVISLLEFGDEMRLQFGYKLVFFDRITEFLPIQCETLFGDMGENHFCFQNLKPFYWIYDGDETTRVSFNGTVGTFHFIDYDMQEFPPEQIPSKLKKLKESIYFIEVSLVVAEIERSLGQMLEYLKKY